MLELNQSKLARLSLALILIWGCNTDEARDDPVGPAPIILISMDGFRWDYVDRVETPNFDYLSATGVTATAMIPVFPSLTFPNHLSIITGRYPENHGIVHNRMWDPLFQEWYTIGAGSVPVADGKWYDAEPFWVTVEKAGLISAIYHWPGSEAEIMGYRPSHYHVFDPAVTNTTKVEKVLEWLDLPPSERPSFIAIYFNEANYYGHRLGVQGSAMDSVIQGLDEDIGQLLTGLEQRGIVDEVNIIVVADHGMVDLDEQRVIFLDDYITLQELEYYSLGPLSFISPPGSEVDTFYNALNNAHPNFKVYLKDALPGHLHYGDHRRIPAIVGIPDEGWYVLTRNYFQNNGLGSYVAAHGYDPLISSMQTIFLAAGPQFKQALTVPKFQNINLYELMAHILELQPAPNDGSLDSVRIMLANP